MNFEPQKFFIGLVDFFSVWLPGAILVYLLTISPPLGAFVRIEGVEGWVVFLVASYLLGHFIFLLGSRLDFLYDHLRNGTRDGQIRRLANGKSLSNRVTRAFGRTFLQDGDKALKCAIRIKLAHLSPLQATDAVNAFQWSKVRLVLHSPDGLGLVNRFEADSKFFRSLVVMLLIAVPWQIWANQRWLGEILSRAGSAEARLLLSLSLAAAVVLVLGFSFWRFVDLRYKATGQAHWLVLGLESERGGEKPDDPRADGPTRAGGLVVRRQSGTWKFLVVAAKKGADDSKTPLDQWVLPKGHIEAGESSLAAAVREVVEEAGIWARPRALLKDVSFQAAGELVEARFYLMDYVGEEPQKSDRKQWLRAVGETKMVPRQHEWWDLASTTTEGKLPNEAVAVLEAGRLELGIRKS